MYNAFQIMIWKSTILQLSALQIIDKNQSQVTAQLLNSKNQASLELVAQRTSKNIFDFRSGIFEIYQGFRYTDMCIILQTYMEVHKETLASPAQAYSINSFKIL